MRISESYFSCGASSSSSSEGLSLPKLTTIVSILGILITGLDGLKDVRLDGPRYVRQGEDVLLRCNYKLDNDSLYVIKWYRGSEEFYRYVPKEVPPKQFFHYSGLSFNEEYCNEHDVFLRNVLLETSGKFKCVVSAEVTFQTFIASQELTVVAIDFAPPTLDIEQLSYYPGETAKANCSLGKVSHPMNFTWIVNDQEILKRSSKEITIPDPEEPSLLLSMSLLQLRVGSSSSPTNNNNNGLENGSAGAGENVVGVGVQQQEQEDAETRVYCRADLFDLYSEKSEEIVIQTTQPRYLSNQDTLRSKSTAPINTNSAASAQNGWTFILLMASSTSLPILICILYKFSIYN